VSFNGASGRLRVAIIGAGFSGIGMAIRLRQAGIEDFLVFEKAEDLGGTWWENSYPGCACDVPSHLYSFSFAPNPSWSRTYSPQPEIWEYLRRCSDEFGVSPRIRLGHEVTDASWDEDRRCWRLETSHGVFEADVLVAGAGLLHRPSIPEFPGQERFEGPAFHSAAWDHSHDLDGRRVAVIGTGASAIQVVPSIQPRVERLHVFQRTAPWIFPRSERSISAAERWLFKRVPIVQRAIRAGVYVMFESRVLGMAYDRRLMRPLEAISRWHLRRQVPDPQLREKLTPTYRMGCKRILVSSEYYPALGQPNVEVVTDAISEIGADSIVTADGREREVDAIVYGTGFEVSNWPTLGFVRGRDGRRITDVWAERGAEAYAGMSVAGFPNMFVLLGPNTGLGHNSVVYMIECQIGYVMDALRTMERQGIATVEVRREAQDAYDAELQTRLGDTVWSSGCASWYLHPSGRNPTIWPGFTWRYRQRTRRFDPAAYRFEPVTSELPAAVAA
jgi:cation diffusion facilitator CzcD-associated flavoprotein CzcO